MFQEDVRGFQEDVRGFKEDVRGFSIQQMAVLSVHPNHLWHIVQHTTASLVEAIDC